MQGSVVATYLHGPCLARNPELADVLYKEAIRPHESFFKVEKLLIAKEIPNLRRKMLKRAE